MTVDEFIEKYFPGDKHRREGRGKYMACCPVHGDSNPSMSVSEGEDGKILLHCFGCGAEPKEILDALGASFEDVMGSAPKPLSDWERKVGRLVCEYIYKNEKGKTVLCKERRVKENGEKTFLQKYPAPAGHPYPWKFGKINEHLKEVGERKPLYKLPELLHAVRSGRPIFWVEGEKDVDTMRSQGFDATTTIDGASGKLEKHYAESFDGASMVYIIPDNDKPPEHKGANGWQGQKFAIVKRKFLEDRGVPVKVLELPALVLGKKVKDATDFFSAGGTADELRSLAEAAPFEYVPPWERPDAPDIPNAPEGEKKASGSTSEKRLWQRWTNREAPAATRVEAFTEWLKLHMFRRDQSVAWAISQVLQVNEDGIKAFHLQKVMADVTVAWLNSRGKLYYHSTYRDFATEMFFSDADKSLCNIQSDWFSSWISRSTGLNREDNRFKKIRSAIQDEGLQGSNAIGVSPENFFARRRDAVYISCGLGQMAKITANKIEMVDNGTDGVLFSVDKTLAPWELTHSPKDPFEHCSIWTAMETTDKQKLLFKLWALSLPFVFDAKPPLSVSGGAGSGKTAIIRGLFRLYGLETRNISVDPGERGENALWVQLHSGGLILLDNIDIGIKWFANSIEAAATAGTKEVKRLYTDTEIVRLFPRAAIAITSLRSMFASSQALSDRMIHIHLNRVNAKETKESELYQEIDDIRDDAMTWIAQTIQAVLADSKRVQHVNRRHPDFGRAAVKIGRAIGCEDIALEALKDAEADKYVVNLRSDTFGEILMQLITRPIECDASYISEMIKAKYGEDFVRRNGWNPHKIGRAIERLAESLKVCYFLRKRMLDGRSVYYFEPSELVLRAVETAFGKSTSSIQLESPLSASSSARSNTHSPAPSISQNREIEVDSSRTYDTTDISSEDFQEEW